MQRLQDAEPVELGALQPHIQDHERGPAQAKGCDRRIAIGRLPHAVALIFQNAFDQHSDVRLVIDNKDFLRHQASVCSAVAGAVAAASTGMDSVTIAPTPSGLSSSPRLPPWSSMIFLTMASPSPVPFGLCVT